MAKRYRCYECRIIVRDNIGASLVRASNDLFGQGELCSSGEAFTCSLEELLEFDKLKIEIDIKIKDIKKLNNPFVIEDPIQIAYLLS